MSFFFRERLPAFRQGQASAVRLMLRLMYLTGFVGLQAEEPLFRLLVPFHLALTTVLLLLFQEQPTYRFWLFCGFVSLTGYAVEVLGVRTGVIFGSYAYGDTLGWKLFGVPLTIGLNWLVLTLSVNCFVPSLLKKRVPRWIRVSLAALLMTSLDVILEPVAVRFGFWYWQDNAIPSRNFLSWYALAWLFSYLYQTLSFPKKNPLGADIFLLQVLFFLAHRLAMFLS
ncbi:MAG: carotenoid biosynthesis protein [Siphonobacter aquaeclarae]|nr:carotenoid biosynthesis protein [Siphonobacter aquaeclarae]